MSVLPEGLYKSQLPEMHKVRQLFNEDKVEDVYETIEREIMRDDIKSRINSGSKVALLVGSRGIAKLSDIVGATVKCLKELGAEPIIIPSMGSHGGGIAEEQKKILEDYEVKESVINAPICSSMETVIIGYTSGGLPVHIDKIAYEADIIIPIAKIKAHPAFEGPIESGLCKMLSIGLGKRNGCSTLHEEDISKFPELLPEVAGIVMEVKHVPFGLAIIENAYDELYLINAVLGEKIIEDEPELLKLSKSLMPRLHFDHIDVLVVEQMGKDISGSGMDMKIIGRGNLSKNFNGPVIKYIVVLDMSEGSHNNAIGIDSADFTTKKVFNKIDFSATYINCLAAKAPRAAMIPMIMENEKEAILAAIYSCHRLKLADAKIVRIKDTLHLSDIEVSESLLDYCKSSNYFSIV